ncbi:protein LZIC-like [Condylostylus longicornis]|uniref:protein LZIC-like n=1 Tax=Condylostylus longicornis TaxID=2530218 RepID=UPI00244E2FE5|nr:protein LZIC-like [Condylostylus longicornis]
MSANEKLILNLEKQLERLVEQLKDLEDCRSELSEDEYSLLKNETAEQIKEFEATLDRLQKGNVTLNSKFSVMKIAIRKAISSAFNTKDMIQMFGDQSLNDLERQLVQIEEDYHLKKIDQSAFEKHKIDILKQLQTEGAIISEINLKFLKDRQDQQLYQRLEQINEN